ncbi:unnamed protein product [Moneuplotes crassus]|uniref:Uncharacterized protein n=1 Tax=Euplotes crassus TaxID=5936 RepID=A0AAD1U7W2_EUPCR|nr:unnamed protein product [Moneuplotes crassus]
MNTNFNKRIKHQMCIRRTDLTLRPNSKRKNKSPLEKIYSNNTCLKIQSSKRFISPTSHANIRTVLNKLKEKHFGKKKKYFKSRGRPLVEFGKRKQPIFHTFHHNPEKRVVSNPNSAKKHKNLSGRKLKNVKSIKASKHLHPEIIVKDPSFLDSSRGRNHNNPATNKGQNAKYMQSTSSSRSKERVSSINPFANYQSFLDQKTFDSRYDSNTKKYSVSTNSTLNVYNMLHSRISQISDKLNAQDESSVEERSQRVSSVLRESSPTGFVAKKPRNTRLESFQLDIINEIPKQVKSKVIVPSKAIKKSKIKSPKRMTSGPSELIPYSRIAPKFTNRTLSPHPSSVEKKFTIKS